MFVIMLYAFPFVQVIIPQHTCYWKIGYAILDPVSCSPGIILNQCSLSNYSYYDPKKKSTEDRQEPFKMFN